MIDAGRSARPASWWDTRVVAAGIALATLGWAAWLVWLVRADPRVVFLAPEAGAQWIVANEPMLLGIRYEGFYMTHFRAWVPAGPPVMLALLVLEDANLRVPAMLDDRCRHPGGRHAGGAHLHAVFTAHQQDLVQAERLSDREVDALQVEGVPGLHPVLFAAGPDDRVHRTRTPCWLADADCLRDGAHD